MPPTFSPHKLLQLSICIFGVFTVYTLHNIIYQRLIMAPFLNHQNNKKQFFYSEAGFVFLEKCFAWVLAEVFSLVVLKKQDKIRLQKRDMILCGLLVFLSGIFFTTGIFELNFRLAFSNRTSGYLAATILGYFIGPYFCPSKSPMFRDLFSGLGIGLGVIIFWVSGEDVWIYTPTKNGYIYNWMVVTSGFYDAGLSLVQATVCQKYRPNEVHLLVSVSRWTALFSFVYVTVIGDLSLTIDFCLSHKEWTLSLFGLALLYFVGQLFIYRATTRMAQNVPAFITTSRKVLTIHQSYALSSHKIHKEQVYGMVISWFSIMVQMILFVKRQQKSKKEFEIVPHHEIEANEVSSEEISVERH